MRIAMVWKRSHQALAIGVFVLVLVASSLVSPANAADESAAPTWREDFNQGIGAAHPYYSDGKTAALEATGEGTIRATLPGERLLEGFRVSATGLPGNRLVTVKARVRGKGDLLLALNSGNGWLYAPTHALTGDWQILTAAKAMGDRDKVLTIYFISSGKKQPGAVFEVDDVQVFVESPLEVADVELPPCKFEAEAFAAATGTVAEDATAGGKRLVADARALRLDGLPFPRTGRPVSVHVRIRTGTEKSRLNVVSTRTGRDQTIRSLALTSSPDWQWVCLPAVSVEEVGNGLSLVGRVDDAGTAPLAIDCVVLSIEAKLDAATLDAVQATTADAPSVCVAKTSQPPAIDGKPDDPCWAGAVAVSDFLAYDTFAPLAQPTTARFAYDATRLFVLLEAVEPVLDVAAQRRHEILAKATQRDGKVLSDDSCLVLLSPVGSEDAYEFSVNTLGTLLDARCRMSDLWSTRDVSWNADVDVAARQEDGYWVAELAIPLAELGVSAPLDGRRWQAAVARIARSRGELGTWNHSQGGAHRPVTMGTLVFGEPTAGLVPGKPLQMFEPGENSLEVAIHPRSSDANPTVAGIYLWSEVRSSDESVSRELTHVPGRTTRAKHTIDMHQSGPVEVTWGALDAATLRPLYVSPTIHTSVRSSQAMLTLSTEGSYRVVVNDQTVASGGSAANSRIRLPLRQGENVIAVEAADGAASLQLEGPADTHTSIRWRMNDAATKDALSSRLDDRTWPLAAPADEKPGGISTLGKSGTPTVFRHTMLLSHTRVWPKPLPALYIADNSVQHINFTATGLAGKRLLNWQVYLAVPAGYEVLGSTGYYGNQVATQPLFQCERVGDVTIDNGPLQLYRVTATKPLLPGRHEIMSTFQLMVRIADAKLAPPGSQSTWYYWTVANDGSLTEPQSSFTVEALPPLAGRQPKEFVLQLWGGLQRMDNDDLREPLLATLQAAGFNEFVSGDRWLADHRNKYGLRSQMLLSFQVWCIDVREHLKQHPDDRLIDRQGKPDDTLMCTSRLLGDGWPVVDRQIARELEENQPDVAQYDYEFPPMTGPHSCYCERCLEAFRSYSKLPEGAALSPDTIQAEHAEAWVDFMACRVARLLQKMKDSVHAARPGTKFSVYSGYHLPDNAARYGIDWRYLGKMRSTDIAGCGYGRPVPAIEDTLEAVNGIPAIFGVLLTPYRTELDRPVTPAGKARLLRRAIDATGGVLVYERRSVDGRWWYAVAEVSRLIASYEDLFLHARPEPIAGQDPANVQILRGKEATLVCVMNDSSKARNITLTLPVDLGDGNEFYSDQAVHAGETVRLELPPGGVAVYVFGGASDTVIPANRP